MVASSKIWTVGWVLGVVAALAIGTFAGQTGSATHQPANKVAVAAAGPPDDSGLAKGVRPTGAPGLAAPDREGVVLTGTLRASKPTDLVIQVTAECALWTTVATFGGDSMSEARATVTLTPYLDGVPVAVTGGGPASVVFCDRLHRATVSDLDDDDARMEHFLATRSANAFNWIALNVGSGVHVIEIVATLETSLSNADDEDAFPGGIDHPLVQAGVGLRTLVVEPTKLANDAFV